VWSYDFVHDRLANQRAMRMLCVVDEHTREVFIVFAATCYAATPTGSSYAGQEARAIKALSPDEVDAFISSSRTCHAASTASGSMEVTA
jgi:hypothetical protein